MSNTQIKPVTKELIRDESEQYMLTTKTNEEVRNAYAEGAKSFATKLQQVEQENNDLKDAISSSDTIIEGLEQSIKLKEEENMRLRASLETMKSIIEQDLIANGNNDLGNRLHIEICVGLKQQP